MVGIKPKSERNYGIDLLRIISMLMVVTLHTLSRSGLITQSQLLSPRYEFSWLLELASYCAVDCFVIISGYVGLNSKFRISRIIQLWVQVVFYLVIAELILQFVNMSNGAAFDINSLINQFLPISNSTYWFFTQYFALSLLMPFINKALKNCRYSSYIALSLVLLILFSLIPCLITSPLPYIGTKFKADLFFTNRGYSILWFIVLYILGCSFKRLREENKLNIKPIFSLMAYTISVLILWALKYYCDSSKPRLSANFAVSYTGVFVVTSAISLVILFENLKIGKTASKIIKFIAPNVFAVYLVNDCPQIYEAYVKRTLPLLNTSALKTVVFLFIIIVGFFIVSVAFDKLRALMFDVLRINKLIKMIDKTPINTFFN